MIKNPLKLADFAQLPDFAALEEQVAQWWEQQQIFAKSMVQTDAAGEVKPDWIFYDGPPFATGLPHYGHILASTTKDVLPRFKTMQGYYVARRWGWDCHGLPIENIVEKELELRDRPSIEAYGADKFCGECKSKVQLYADEWKKIIRRLGRFVDMENDYKTMDLPYMESVWWVFKTLWDKDLIYKDYKPMHLCPRCSTPLSNFEVTEGYKEVTDLTAYIKFKLVEPETLNLGRDTYLIAWTTTPWTLPGNFLLAVDNETTYSVVVLDEKPDEYLVIATARLGEVMPAEQKYKVVSGLQGADLVGKNYEPVFPYFVDEREKSGAFRVVDVDFVSEDEGTGIVHIAPSFGEDDFLTGKREGLPMIHTVDENGRFMEVVTDFAGALVKSKEEPMATDIEVIKYLAARQALFRKQKVKHSYPHCWRCDTPLLNYATSSFFVKVTALKEQLLQNNEQLNWQPQHMKYGRFGKWLEGAKDWAISRRRFWGTPLPLWVSEDGEFICVGSKEELEELTGQQVNDLHQPTVSKLTIVKGEKTYSNVGLVLDCWFESGSMPYASCHYPFNNKGTFDSFFPADFISEGQDQTRGWFYTLHVLATALTGELGEDKKPAIEVEEKATGAFKNVLVNGIVLAEDGKKMSKRLNNYPDPMEVMAKYGADSLRFYLMSSPVMRAENLNFVEKEVADVRRKLVVMLWNVVAFYKGVVGDGDETSENFELQDLPVLDQWLLSQLAEYSEKLTAALENFDLPTACRLQLDFIDELSTWYLRLSRVRLREDGRSRAVFGFVLQQFIISIAPIAPFVSEILYQNLNPKKLSVHLEAWLAVENLRQYQDQKLSDTVAMIRKAVEEGRRVRQSLGLKLRQPLVSATVNFGQEFNFSRDDFAKFVDLLKDELNVKSLDYSGDLDGRNVAVSFETKLTPELIAEGQARELMRAIKDARKKAGLKESDAFEYKADEVPKDWRERIEQATNTRLV